ILPVPCRPGGEAGGTEATFSGALRSDRGIFHAPARMLAVAGAACEARAAARACDALAGAEPSRQFVHHAASLGIVHRCPAGNLVERARAADAVPGVEVDRADAVAGRRNVAHRADHFAKITWSASSPSVSAAGPGCRMIGDFTSCSSPSRTAGIATQ